MSSLLNRGVSRFRCRSPREFKKLVTRAKWSLSVWRRKIAWHRVSDIQLEGNWRSTTKVKARILPSISHTSAFWLGVIEGRCISPPCNINRVPTTASQNNKNISLVTPSPTPSSLSKSTLCHEDGLRPQKWFTNLYIMWSGDLDLRRDMSWELVVWVLEICIENLLIISDNL